MKKITFLLFLILDTFIGWAQNDLNKANIETSVSYFVNCNASGEIPTEIEYDDKVYTTEMVQQKPEFPGGEAAMSRWLADHISYPAQASEEGVEGRVVVSFVVSEVGNIEDIRVARGRHPALDKEAVRLVKSMPEWTPARKDGKDVSCSYSLPITFKSQY